MMRLSCTGSILQPRAINERRSNALAPNSFCNKEFKDAVVLGRHNTGNCQPVFLREGPSV